MRAIFEYTVKLSILGNAVLFVVLVGGSHVSALPGQEYISPHKPVHFARQLTPLLNQDPYLDEINLAQQAWDDNVYEGGGNIIINGGPTSNLQPFDSVVVNMSPAPDSVIVTFRAHNGQTNDKEIFLFDTEANAEVQTWFAAETGVNQVMKVMILNDEFWPDRAPVLRWRTLTHEFGHVLGLGHHLEAYAGMMDGACCDDYPADFIIQNYTSLTFPFLYPIINLFPDEASCVRTQFNVQGKKGCAPAP